MHLSARRLFSPKIKSYLDEYFQGASAAPILEKIKDMKDRTQITQFLEKEAVPIIYSALPEKIRKEYTDRELSGQLMWFLIEQGTLA